MDPAAQLKEQTYAPNDADLAALAGLYVFFDAAYRSATKDGLDPHCLCLLEGPEAGQRIELPSAVYRVLLQAIAAMSEGLAVTVIPQRRKLTTQQAAEMLGVTRPTLVRLLDAGKIPFERVGTHRRVLLGDVLAYRDERREEQYRFLDETAVPIHEEDDVEDVLATLREARKKASRR